MGERGPLIFDRHFFTLVRKYLALFHRPPRRVIDTMSTTLNGSTLSGSLSLDWWHFESQCQLEQYFNSDFYIRCQCSTTSGNLQGGLQSKIGLPRFYSKARNYVWQSLILQSWFNKSLDACVLEGDAECQVLDPFWFVLDPCFPGWFRLSGTSAKFLLWIQQVKNSFSSM